jgi:peroxiredoxin
MKTPRLVFLICLTYIAAAGQSANPQLEGKTRVGQPMPSFKVTDTSGNLFSIPDLKGKVVVVNFWATWCGPCTFEIPRLEKEIWQKHKSDNFAMVAIAREQSPPEITAFRQKQHFTYPIAPDPHRSIYARFADSGIPRTYVVGTNGTILFQSLGYNPVEFDQMKKVVEHALSSSN